MMDYVGRFTGVIGRIRNKIMRSCEKSSDGGVSPGCLADCVEDLAREIDAIKEALRRAG